MSYPDELLPDTSEPGLNGLDPTLSLDALRAVTDDGFSSPSWGELPDDVLRSFCVYAILICAFLRETTLKNSVCNWCQAHFHSKQQINLWITCM